MHIRLSDACLFFHVFSFHQFGKDEVALLRIQIVRICHSQHPLWFFHFFSLVLKLIYYYSYECHGFYDRGSKRILSKQMD